MSRLPVSRLSVSRLRLVWYGASRLNDDNLLPTASGNKATPYPPTKEESDCNVAARFKIPGSAVKNHSDDVEDPDNHREDDPNDALRATDCVHIDVSVEIVIVTPTIAG